MIAFKLPGLLFLFGVVCVVRNAQATEQAADGGQDGETLYVGLKFLVDSSIASLFPFEKVDIEAYLRAFTGGVQLRFWELTDPGVKVVYQGWRNLTVEEERSVIGDKKSAGIEAVKGGAALLSIMAIALEEDDGIFTGTNTVAFVLTTYDITEGKTTKKVDKPSSRAISFESDGDSESDESSETISERSNRKKELSNVGGLAQYGSACETVIAAICQDNGRNFSGVEIAARLVATVMGPMYNGSIPRRICDEEDSPDHTEFHNEDCQTVRTSKYAFKTEDYDCLKEEIGDIQSRGETPSTFFTEHNPAWTPCNMSYTDSKKCTEGGDAAVKKSICQMSCCTTENITCSETHYRIPAPDGEQCGGEKEVCIGGTCVNLNCQPNVQHSQNS